MYSSLTAAVDVESDHSSKTLTLFVLRLFFMMYRYTYIPIKPLEDWLETCFYIFLF